MQRGGKSERRKQDCSDPLNILARSRGLSQYLQKRRGQGLWRWLSRPIHPRLLPHCGQHHIFANVFRGSWAVLGKAQKGQNYAGQSSVNKKVTCNIFEFEVKVNDCLFSYYHSFHSLISLKMVFKRLTKKNLNLLNHEMGSR